MRNTKSNSNIVFDCKYHVVFCPKYRKQVLKNEVKKRLLELFKEKTNELDVDVQEVEVMPDHVHLLISCDPQYGIHRVIKQLKGHSSKILREEFKHLKSSMPSLWTNSYFVATTGGVNLEVIKEYIQNQETRG